MKEHAQTADLRAVDKSIEKAYALKDEVDRLARSGSRGEPNGATGGIGSAGNRYCNRYPAFFSEEFVPENLYRRGSERFA